MMNSAEPASAAEPADTAAGKNTSLRDTGRHRIPRTEHVELGRQNLGDKNLDTMAAVAGVLTKSRTAMGAEAGAMVGQGTRESRGCIEDQTRML